MNQQKLNLFVYGSLRDPTIFKSVCGLRFTLRGRKKRAATLLAEPAFLAAHRRVSPDNVYFYAVPSSAHRIEGYLIYDVPPAAFRDIDKYEGRRYDRETVTVHTAEGPVPAESYLTSREKMKKYFGDRFHVNLIHELWLRKRIEKFIRKHTRPGERSADANLERRADRQLLATTERDLVISHYRHEALGDYILKTELNRPRPHITEVCREPEAIPYLANYLALVVKQTILNIIDGKIYEHHRFELEHMRSSERYFKRTFSLLIALRMLNASTRDVDRVIKSCLETMPPGEYDLIHYIKYAVSAADSIYVDRLAKYYLNWVNSNLQPGLIPLGTEIELSNLGFKAIPAHRRAGVTGPADKDHETDAVYNSFKYFHDFCLDTLTWKVGGYIDDHTGSTSPDRRQGFLELAPGRLNVRGDLSRPATADPWVLNQLIREIVTFYEAAPHSLHLSFQLLKRQIGKQKPLPLGFVKCLLVLGGGLKQTLDGTMWVSRIAHDEITANQHGAELSFARTSKRKWYLGEDEIADRPPPQAENWVQQYKFIRLDQRANYEPLILALKGLQIALNPGDYLTIDQLSSYPHLRADFTKLLKWAANPTPIGRHTVSRFITTVQHGLMHERPHGPAHKRHYIDWALGALDVQLRIFNKELREKKP